MVKLRCNLRSWANDPESGLLTVLAVRGAGRDVGEGKRLIYGRWGQQFEKCDT